MLSFNLSNLNIYKRSNANKDYLKDVTIKSVWNAWLTASTMPIHKQFD
jgi:hypothetical protein